MIELIIMPVIGISLASGMPSLLRVRTAEREASAIESVQTINEAQANYAASCGGGFCAVAGRPCDAINRHC